MTDPESLVNALADRYRIERELGAGGMATVYLAEDLKHRRRVAIKVLKPELAAALGPERFQREIEIAAALRHAHILPLYDSGDAGGSLYYVMPFVEGETLRDRLTRDRQFPVEDALRLAREVADALAYAHAHGVVHRDIKPENILLEAGHAVVADFGIAKAMAAAGEQTALTQSGMSVGTPAYMSPEQSAGDPGVDGRSDLYSLGCVLYEMLAGQPPFTGPTVESLVRQHITAPAPPVTQFRPAVPAAVADALARALAKNPADRFNPVDQFGTALHHRPAGSGVASTLQATRTSASRRAVPWIAAALLMALVAAGWAGMRRGGARDASIAVLPLRIADGDSSSSALALGVQGELITQLTQVPGLRVASRGAMRELIGSGSSEREMAQTLGVATVLSGDIQRSGSQVRLTMALSDPGKGAELWGQRYDRELTTSNLFAIQAEIARSVAEALRLRLAPAAAGDSVPPTQNVAALEFFYRAEATYLQLAGSNSDAEALNLAERAVSLDSAFARGWALVTRLRSWQVRTGQVTDTMPAHAAMIRTQQLGPGSIEAQLAEGYYRYYTQADFRGALTALEAAARLQPASMELNDIRALIHRRLGQFEDARRLLAELAAADPGSAFALGTLGETLTLMRHYDDAEAAFARAEEAAPTNSFIRTSRVLDALQVRGDTALARQIAADAKPILGPWANAVTSLDLALYTRDLDAALQASQEALSGRLDRDAGSQYLKMATLERSLGHDAAARTCADSLRVHAASYSERFRAGSDPFGGRILAELSLALADALQGKRTAALSRTEAAARQLSRERDAVEHVSMMRWVAAVYALTGEREKAVAVLRDLLAFPGDLHRGELRLNPLWDDLRGMPEFEQLAREP